MSNKILPEPVFIQNAMMLNKLLQHTNIEIKTSTKLVSIQENDITIESNGNTETLSCDNVVLAMGFLPNVSLYNELKDLVPIANVGDSVSVRKVFDAVHEAFDAVLKI